MYLDYGPLVCFFICFMKIATLTTRLQQPSIGISRSARWRRAHKLGMEPPIEVLAVLLKEGEVKPGKAQKSIIDELMMSSRVSKEVALEV